MRRYGCGSRTPSVVIPAKAGHPVRCGPSIPSLLPLEYWIVAQSLAPATMTLNMCSRSRGALRPRFASSFALLEIRGRREDRVLAAPAVSRAICANKSCTRAYRAAGNTPAFPAQWLYGLLRALPGERLFCLRRPREASLLADLTPAPRRPNHTTSPYASSRTRQSQLIRVHRISPHVRDDGERPSSAVRQAELCR